MFFQSKLTSKIYKLDNGIYTLVIQDSNDIIYNEQLQWLKDNKSIEEFEGTPEEIAEQQQAETLLKVKKFMQQKQEDGNSFYNDIDLRITVALSAMDKETLFPKLAEIDSLLYPPLNKIKTGDFASALYLFSNQTAPSDAFVLNFYNEALTFCQTYYENKYPK